MEHTEWSVRVGYQPADIATLIARIEDDNAPPTGVFAMETNADTGRVTLSVDITARAADQAASWAVRDCAPTAAALSLGEPVAVEVVRWVDGPGTVSLAPVGLLSMGEVAELLGVTRQRAHVLAQSDPAFPAPVETTPAGAIYDRAAVKAYAATRRRTGGRPRRSA